MYLDEMTALDGKVHLASDGDVNNLVKIQQLSCPLEQQRTIARQLAATKKGNWQKKVNKASVLS